MALQALLKRFDDHEANPTSEIYGRPMLDAGGSCVWCWDARPYPDFPARRTVWADAPNWSLGHWLNGRAGASSLAALVAALAARGGVEVDVSGLSGLVTGYLVDHPMPIAGAIAPLAAAFAFDACERGGQAAFVMRDGGGGSIVNIGTMAAYGPGPSICAYGSSKAGLLNLTKAMAMDWAKWNVRVNLLSPGPFTSEMLLGAASKDPGYLDMVAGGTHLKRVADPQEIVGPVLYLASDASTYVTADDISVSGGMMK